MFTLIGSGFKSTKNMGRAVLDILDLMFVMFLTENPI